MAALQRWLGVAVNPVFGPSVEADGWTLLINCDNYQQPKLKPKEIPWEGTGG